LLAYSRADGQVCRISVLASGQAAAVNGARVGAAALVGYAAVGWCVLALVTAFIGDPLAIYLLSTHSNAMRYALPIVPFALLPLLVHIRPPRL